ncbi:unnamed protein product [Rhodiola kirilowii]
MESNGSCWLADSLHAVDNNVKQLLKLIEDKNFQISNKDSETEDERKPDIATYVDELHSHYHLLAERYSHLVKEQGKNVDEMDENSVSPFYTPVSKFTEHKPEPLLQAVGSDILLSDRSYKNGFGSSSTSLSDSDLDNPNLESFTNGTGADEEKSVAENGKEDKLLKQIEEYEVQLQIANARLKSSDEDAAEFKSKLEESEILVKQLQDEFELAQALAERQDAAISMEKSKVSELEGRISSNADELFKYSEEVQRLKEALTDVHNVLDQKSVNHQSEISSFLDQKNLAEKILEERELRTRSLENEISELKIEISQVKSAHNAKETMWKTEMKSLEAENMARGETVETLNKYADALKLKYDMASARLETLPAELSHKDNMMQQLNDRINLLISEKANLSVTISNLTEDQNAVRQIENRATESQLALCKAISESDELSKCVDKLRVRVTELEEEVEKQRDLVAEGAELKREAIRQLCISLEHYRSGYLELREAVVGKRKRTAA